GLINLDFADVKAIMANAGSALMGIGKAKGDNRAVEAARQAIDSPLLETSIDGARGVLFNVTGGRSMTMHEIDEAAKTITEAVASDANIIFGAVLDDALEDDLQITVVATGFDGHRPEREVTVRSVSRPEAVAEPVFAPEVVMPTMRPLINERPQTEVEPEPMAIPVTKPVVETTPPRRFAPLASIEPDEEVEESEDLTSEAKSPAMDYEPEVPEAAPQPLADLGLADDDNLDVPAFIRRKVE
ncbi:MAG TPA: hypothetical protein VLF67_03380, partial [Candidatus Saccharimonas sp.]|nr:hypothetical protein [Candidatus Saccharimonas sp.]